MNNTNTITRERATTESTSNELSKTCAVTIAASSAIIGLWAVACMTSAMISSGGPAGLAANFISALVG